MNGSRTRRGAGRNNNNNSHNNGVENEKEKGSSSESNPQRIRRLLEPLIMSIITTLLVFHMNVSSDTSPAFLDAPTNTNTHTNTNTNTLPVVKRRYPDPPTFDYHQHIITKNKTTSSSQSTPIFFYHIYVPEENTETENAHRIVKEQLDQLSKAPAKAPPLNQEPITVFYQTVGSHQQLNAETIAKLCQERNMNCHSMGHYDDGREELTLQHVYNFCHADANSNNNNNNNNDRRVVYFHNKGSHHYSTINERWRKKMMAAITNEKCLQPPMATCNICSLFLTAERGIFLAGNFWVAHCNYIRQLLPPLDFEGHMERVVKDALYLRLENKLTMNMHRHWPPSFGTGRYAAEYWSGSHPSIVPCDFSHSFAPGTQEDNTNDFLKWVNASTTAKSPLKWTMAPKHPIKINNKSVRTSESLRLPEYFLLAGNIFRWYELYGDVPGEFSWVWAWFPDGRKWRNAIRRHGRNAITELTKFRATEA